VPKKNGVEWKNSVGRFKDKLDQWAYIGRYYDPATGKVSEANINRANNGESPKSWSHAIELRIARQLQIKREGRMESTDLTMDQAFEKYCIRKRKDRGLKTEPEYNDRCMWRTITGLPLPEKEMPVAANGKKPIQRKRHEQKRPVLIPGNLPIMDLDAPIIEDMVNYLSGDMAIDGVYARIDRRNPETGEIESQKLTKGTVNRTVQLVRRVYLNAADRLVDKIARPKMIAAFAWKKFLNEDEETKKTVLPSNDEVADIISKMLNLLPKSRDAVEFALCTGPRRTNVINLEWDKFKWGKTIVVYAKSAKAKGKKYPIYWTPLIERILSRQLNPGVKIRVGAQVKPGQAKHPTAVFTYVQEDERKVATGAGSVLRKAGEVLQLTKHVTRREWRNMREELVLRLRWHDLRHLYMKHARLALGGDKAMMRDLAVHEDEETTDIYDHIDDPLVQAAALRVATEIEQSMRAARKPKLVAVGKKVSPNRKPQ
jgi:integrase